MKELEPYRHEITGYFERFEPKQGVNMIGNKIELALKLLENVTDVEIKERISIGILKQLGY